MQQRCHPQVLLAWLGSIREAKQEARVLSPNGFQQGNPASDVLLVLSVCLSVCLSDGPESDTLLGIPNTKSGSWFDLICLFCFDTVSVHSFGPSAF
jgi:hypothetical protein